MAATEHIVHFSIEGEFLANHARDRVCEGAWERALKLLTEDLQGMTHELAIAILKGEADLTGCSGDEAGIGIKNLPKDGPKAKAMAAQMQFLYGSTFRYREKYWKPYARVTSWGEADSLFALEDQVGRVLETTGARFYSDRPYAAKRSLYYADDRIHDLLVIFKVSKTQDAFILCKETSMPPLWFDTPCGPAEQVLSKMLKDGLVLEERGEAYRDAPAGRVCSIRKAAKRSTKSKKTTRFFKPSVQPVLSEAEETARIEELEKKRARRLQEIAEAVKTQAKEKGGFYRLNLEDGIGKPYAAQPVIEVPRNPFLLWALRGYDFERFGKKAPEWDAMSPQGLKMLFDDPYHSDWILGAGLPLEDVYDHGEKTLTSIVMSSAILEQFKLVKEWTGMEFVTLAYPGEPRYFSGPVVIAKPNQPVPAGSIAIAATAGPEYQFAMETACQPDKYGSKGLIICATGGKLAHLATVGREFKCTVLMVPDAVEKYQTTRCVSVDMDEGKIYHSL